MAIVALILSSQCCRVDDDDYGQFSVSPTYVYLSTMFISWPMENRSVGTSCSQSLFHLVHFAPIDSDQQYRVLHNNIILIPLFGALWIFIQKSLLHSYGICIRRCRLSIPRHSFNVHICISANKPEKRILVPPIRRYANTI